MKSWSQRELALAVLVVLAAIFVPYAAVPLLARLEQLPLQQCDAADPVPLRLDLGLGEGGAVFWGGAGRAGGAPPFFPS